MALLSSQGHIHAQKPFFFSLNLSFLHVFLLFFFCRNEYEYGYEVEDDKEEEEEEEEEEAGGTEVERTTFLDKEAETRMSRWQSQLPDEEELLFIDLEEPWLMESSDPLAQIKTSSSVYESPQPLQREDDNDEDDPMPKEVTVSLK